MICENYNLLSHRERIEYVGKLIHSVQSSNQLFIIGNAIIKQAEEMGILDDVIILPTAHKTETDEHNPVFTN